MHYIVRGRGRGRIKSWIIKLWIMSKGLSKEFRVTGRWVSSRAIWVSHRRKRWSGKIVGDIFVCLPEVTRRVRIRKVLTFPIDESFDWFSIDEIWLTDLAWFQTEIKRPWVSRDGLLWYLCEPPFSIINSTRPRGVKPKFPRFLTRESGGNVHLHAIDNHLHYPFSTCRWIYDMEAVVIS